LAVGSWQLAVGSWQLATDLAAKMQPQLQKLLWRIQAASRDRDFFTGRSEGQKAKNVGARAAASGLVLRCAPNGAASHQTF
jgi:hypothetical protein